MNRKNWYLCFVRDGIMVFTSDYEGVCGKGWNEFPEDDYADWPNPKTADLKYLGFMEKDVNLLRSDRYGNMLTMKEALINNEQVIDLGDCERDDGELVPVGICYGDSARSVVGMLRWAGVMCGWLK